MQETKFEGQTLQNVFAELRKGPNFPRTPRPMETT